MLSSHSPPILLFLDDIQWADAVSLLIVDNLLLSVASKPVFFTFCHRDEELGSCEALKAWLVSLMMFNIEVIKVKELDARSVNEFLSDALSISLLRLQGH